MPYGMPGIKPKYAKNSNTTYTLTLEPRSLTQKKHIANYFEELYQAREGAAWYSTWTNKIIANVRRTLEKPYNTKIEEEEQISEKEMNLVIKKKAVKEQKYGPR